jgi:hypothetical protein
MLDVYRWEYSPLARYGNFIWSRLFDPLLRCFADDELAFLRRARGVIQVLLLIAILLLPISPFYNTGHLLTASGLLFDIAGILRLFLFEEVREALSGYKDRRRDNLPSVAMRELVMPEASGPYNDEDSPHISSFYYEKRGVLFLFVGFMLQLLGDLF